MKSSRRNFIKTGLIFVPAFSGIVIPSLADSVARRRALLKQKASASGGSSTEFISATSAGSGDNNSTGLNGFKFTVGGAGITVTDLGMLARADDADNTKTVAIYDASCALIISASVDISAHDDTYKYTSITPTALSASTTYHITFNNPNSRNFVINSTPTRTSVATIDQDVWNTSAGVCGTLFAAAEKICVGPNFKY